jgi:flagellar motor switch protein FliM
MSDNPPPDPAQPSLDDPAAWGLDAAEGGSTGAPAPASDLSQGEIDALFQASGAVRKEPTHPVATLGARAEEAPVSLPLLEPIFDRVARSADTHLRNFFSDNASCSFEGMRFLRLRDFIERIEVPSITAVLRSTPWHTAAVMAMSSRLVYAAVDHLLGGRSAQSPKLEGRSFSTIERRLMGRLARTFLETFDSSFTMIPPPAFSVERMEAIPRFALVSAPGQKVVSVRFTINVNDRGGPVDLALPLVALLPFKDALGVITQTEDTADERERLWMTQQTHGVAADVAAVVAERRLSMDDVMAWKPGSVVDLDTSLGGPLTIYVNGTPLFRAVMGRRGPRYAVRVEETLPESPRRGSRIYLPEELEIKSR